MGTGNRIGGGHEVPFRLLWGGIEGKARNSRAAAAVSAHLLASPAAGLREVSFFMCAASPCLSIHSSFYLPTILFRCPSFGGSQAFLWDRVRHRWRDSSRTHPHWRVSAGPPEALRRRRYRYSFSLFLKSGVPVEIFLRGRAISFS